MPFASLDGLDFYYERQGDGPRLLFISGTGGDLRNKPNIMDSPLPQGFDLVAYDQRGLGRSAKPDIPCSMADYADDAARLMDALGWAQAKVIGVSFGGMVAQELALRHPARVERLVLACTSPGGAGGASYPFHEIEHLKGEVRARHLIPISHVGHDEAWAETHPGHFKLLLAMGSADLFADEPGHAMGAHRQLEARKAHDTWERLEKIACPTLIAAGRHDGIALPQTQLNMAARIPGAALEFFDGGHAFLLEDKTAFGAVAAFLAG